MTWLMFLFILVPLVNVHAVDSYGGWNVNRASRLLSLNSRTTTTPAIETTIKVEEKKNINGQGLFRASFEPPSQPEPQDIKPKTLGIQLPHQRHVLMAKPLPPPSRIRILSQESSPEYTHNTKWEAAYTYSLDTKRPTVNPTNNETPEESTHTLITETPDLATNILLPSRTLLQPLDRSRSVQINILKSDSAVSEKPIPEVSVKSISTVLAAENVDDSMKNKEEEIYIKENEMVSQYEPSYKLDTIIKTVTLATEEPKVSVPITTPLPSRQLWLSKPLQRPVVITDKKFTHINALQSNPRTASSFLRTGLHTEAMSPNKELQIERQRVIEKQESEAKNSNDPEVIVTIPLVLDNKKEELEHIAADKSKISENEQIVVAGKPIQYDRYESEIIEKQLPKINIEEKTDFNEEYQSEVIEKESKIITKTVEDQNTEVNEEHKTMNEDKQKDMITEKQPKELKVIQKSQWYERNINLRNKPILTIDSEHEYNIKPSSVPSVEVLPRIIYRERSQRLPTRAPNTWSPQITGKPEIPERFTTTSPELTKKPLQKLPSLIPKSLLIPDLESNPNNADSPQLFDYECKTSNGFHSIENNCDSYIECKKYAAFMFTCPDGLHFNRKAIWPEYPCSYPWEVECQANYRKNDPQPTGDCPHRFGVFPLNDEDCSKYIMCHEGKANLMSCPLGLVFNTKESACDWPVNVPSCRPKVFQGFTCPALNEGDDYDFIYKYRYGESCRDYIACQQGKPRLLSCDRGLAFDAESQVCVDAEFVENCRTY